MGRVRVRELRLISGLVLLLFVLTHLANHALGLVSVTAMDRGLAWFTLIWHHPIGTGLLYGAVLVHFSLGLYALYTRQILRMPARELAQLLLGLILPFLLVEHVIGTRLSYALTGKQVTYTQVVYALWIAAPNTGLRQVLALLVAWLHGCLGLYFWLRHRPWFANYSILLYTAALVIPLLALLGFAEAGKDLIAIAYEPPATPLPADLKTAVARALYGLFAGLILSTFAARLARRYVSWTSKIRVAYATGQVAIVPRGFTVLEASRSAGIPHVAVCGGRGRCSTCRVRVLDGLEGQPPPSSQEQATLHRIKAVENVRLACQFKPVHDVTVAPILAAGRLRLLESESRSARGREHVITVLFCDLRAFTTLSERRLPFDIVFLLNRYFEVVGHAVEETGGLVDKFVGDGALAIFGLDGSRKRAARQAITAALRISRGVAELNRTYASELDRPLRLAMSLHTGPAIIGEMGYGAASQLTAVGDTINTASRLEGIAKDLDAELVVSAEVTRTAELAPPEYDLQSFAMRGRSAPVMAWIVKDTKSITHLVEDSAVNAMVAPSPMWSQ